MFTTSHFAIELVEHDVAWAEIAAREGERLRGALGDVLIEVLHIGSTAIPGIRAKPIVDLSPVVRSLDELDAKQSAVEALGYEWRGELGIARRRYCVLVDPANGRRISQLHCFASGDDEIARHVVFRDYMRAHRDEALGYEAEKLRARDLHPNDVNAYNEAKSAWIRERLARARAWRDAGG
jgi:GrpB-like predicted nucleotidyltransferase (UPF0157 family)